MKLPNDLVQNFNNGVFNPGHHPVGLGDILAYLCNTLGEREEVIPGAHEETDGVPRPAPQVYEPGKISKDAEYVLVEVLKMIKIIHKRLDKENETASHDQILKALVSLEKRVRDLENTLANA